MAYQLDNVKILIVEDMVPMLSLTVSLLKVFGFKNVDGASGVEEAYKIFRRQNHDLVITDWLMEPFDGLDLIHRIRNENDSPNKFVPIILMTGYSDRPRVETARDTGVTEFLMKPYNARDLYARIVQIIEKPRAFVDTGEFFGPDRRRRKNFDYLGYEKRGEADKNSRNWPEDMDIDLVLRDLADEAKKL